MYIGNRNRMAGDRQTSYLGLGLGFDPPSPFTVSPILPRGLNLQTMTVSR